MTDARHDLHRRTIRQERAIDQATAALAPAIRDAVIRHAVATPDGPRITPAARRRILREVDAALDVVYGRRRGAASPLLQLILTHARKAQLAVIESAVQDIGRRTPTDLRTAMVGDDTNA